MDVSASALARPQHELIHRDPHAYCAHPFGIRCADGEILVVFNRAPRRAVILHPPQDPYFENVMVRSSDGGETWSAPTAVPDHGRSGAECAGLTVLKSGRVILNQWRFRWYPLPLARTRAVQEGIAFPSDLAATLLQSPELDSGHALRTDPERLMPWGRGRGRTYVHLSDDGGQTFAHTVEIATAPFSGGYGMRGAVETDDGTLVLPLCDIPDYRRIFVVRSRDQGQSWDAPILVAEIGGRLFEEPAPLLLPDGRLLLLLRENVGRVLFQTHSDDGGLTWSEPRSTGLAGYPAHLLRLTDGRLLCTYGRREAPLGIYAVVSEDDGCSWMTDEPIALRSDLPNKDLGYPVTIQVSDSDLLTVYYAQDCEGVTGIWQSRWTQPQ